MNEQTTPRLTVALDAAERYFATRLRADLWREASESDKTNALAQASFLISGAFSFYDAAFALDESTGEVVWNARVVAAVCEEALWLLRVDPTEYPEALTLGLAEAGAGGASAKFDRSFVAPMVCAASKTLVGELGVFRDSNELGTAKTTPFAC